jgi:heme-degrading monooxygenase HmoA
MFAETPQPPYWAVIFTSQRRLGDHGYGQMADEMETLARQQPGFLGVESARDTAGLGITVSYWDSEAAVVAWKVNAAHQVAQRLGHELWYQAYSVRIAKVERAYEFDASDAAG